MRQGGRRSKQVAARRGSELRITGGELAGLRVRIPPRDVRPTADRVRESLFARLDTSGAFVLDLFAGSGSLGFESLSRGAEQVVFVDRARSCVRTIEANLERHGLAERAQVICCEAAVAIRRLAAEGRRFDLALLDPPYASSELDSVLPLLVEAGVLSSDAVVVVESPKRNPVRDVPGLEILDTRDYGETRITRWIVARAGITPNS